MAQTIASIGQDVAEPGRVDLKRIPGYRGTFRSELRGPCHYRRRNAGRLVYEQSRRHVGHGDSDLFGLTQWRVDSQRARSGRRGQRQHKVDLGITYIVQPGGVPIEQHSDAGQFKRQKCRRGNGGIAARQIEAEHTDE